MSEKDDPITQIIVDNIKLHLQPMYENSDKIDELEKEKKEIEKESVKPALT